MNYIALIVIGVVIETTLSPRLDYTHGDQLLLWYGKKERKSFLIFDNN